MGQIQFDSENHLYYDGEIRIPSVTEILEIMGVSDYSFLDEEESIHYRHRGTFVHGAASQICRERFNPATHQLYPLFSPYIRAFEMFIAGEKNPPFYPRNSELILYCEDWGLAGTMDLDGAFEGDSFITEIEIKTGTKPKWAVLQAAAYREMHNRTVQARVSRAFETAPIAVHRILTLKKNDYILSRKQGNDEHAEQLADYLRLLEGYKVRKKWREEH